MKIKLSSAILITFIFSFLQSSFASEYENHSMMLVESIPAEKMGGFLRSNFDIVRILPDGGIKIVATSADRELLISEYNAITLVKNLEEYYRSRLDASKDMGGYHTYSETYNDLLSFSYNSVARLDTIGYSLEGRPIYALKISDNVDVDEDEPEIMINSAIHAREVITVELILYFIDYLLDGYDNLDSEIMALIDSTEIWLVPIANPDGYYYNEYTNPYGGGMWRKNRRNNGDGTYGVDLNRNWGFRWGLNEIGSSSTTSSEVYRGTAPFSEPETQVLRDFIISRDLAVIVNYHSSGNMYLKPWGFNRAMPNPDYNIYGPMLDSLTSFNGYAIYPDMYEINGGAPDWQYGEQFEKRKIFAFLPEVGPNDWGFWPPSTAITTLCEDNLPGNLFFVREAKRLWKRPSRSIATSSTFLDTTFAVCLEDFTYVAKLKNIDAEDILEISVDYSGTSISTGWFHVDTFTQTLYPGDSVSINMNISPKRSVNPPGENYNIGFSAVFVSNQNDPSIVDTLRFPVLLTTVFGDDADDDNVIDICDNCPDTANTDQLNSDDDSYGDACDNCPEVTNEDQLDLNENDIGDVCEWMCGDVNNNAAINLLDATYIISFLYKSGPGPVPHGCIGDASGNGPVNLLDVTYLIAFLYKDGPAPPYNCCNPIW